MKLVSSVEFEALLGEWTGILQDAQGYHLFLEVRNDILQHWINPNEASHN